MSDPRPIRNVSDTALWVAIYRAMESERPDAHFRDPFARRLGGERGEAIVRSMPKGTSMSWPMVVRTAVMDELLLAAIDDGVTTVLNLAAGLDARPWRLDLPPTLRWLHVDLPDMVEYFRGHMAGETPRCEVEFIAADLREAGPRRAAIARALGHGPVLAITEGLLVYLESEQVAELAREIHTLGQGTLWLSDLASPRLLRMLARNWQRNLQQGNAPFRFGPEENTGFFAPLGWRELAFRSTWAEALRLKRTMRGAWMWQLLSHLQSAKQRDAMHRMSGIMLLEAE
ncbi:class I SAM-dependent methyltransferase [Marilutibacter spongiae]|uniref:S-adenosyl-L-methionine-dependent methyltransferase n=1 Tax=Marilutibacter spongiae TaxID=2025720 RepID=A0A7W3Y6T4_9GAMM|nr:SAM-dependent methyltransferase [Lysobacter spongiae]MBB1061828.1 class I SAM-dependent methyltransferase [Lysobacter spongiae]